jgi:conjugative transfer signal peptidase TraF
MKLWLSRLSLILISVMSAGLFLTALGLRINTSNSIPKGLYWVSKEKFLKGSYVLFCPSNTPVFQKARMRGIVSGGLCPGGFGYLMKQVAAVGRDLVSSHAEGVSVNGHLLPFSQPKAIGLTVWQIDSYRVKSNEVLLMTDQNKWSFDARYFGLINKGLIKEVIKPLFIQVATRT